MVKSAAHQQRELAGWRVAGPKAGEGELSIQAALFADTFGKLSETVCELKGHARSSRLAANGHVASPSSRAAKSLPRSGRCRGFDFRTACPPPETSWHEKNGGQDSPRVSQKTARRASNRSARESWEILTGSTGLLLKTAQLDGRRFPKIQNKSENRRNRYDLSQPNERNEQ